MRSLLPVPSRETLCGRLGVSLVEVMVVIGVLGLLASLAIPAVQQAREASRRTTCQNNLRQIGTALHNAVDAHGAFPTAQLPENAMWRLLPYLDAAPLYEALTTTMRPASWVVPVLGCPSDPVVHVNMYTVPGDASYFYNRGTRFSQLGKYNGFSSDRVDIRPAEIIDGLSQTAALSERLVRPWGTNGSVDAPEAEMIRETRRYFWWTETRYGPGDEQLAVDNCRNHRTTVLPQFYGVNAHNLRSNNYDHLLPPNHPACYNGPEDFQVQTSIILVPASSLHPGGAHSLFADGSVHFVSESIDGAVWQALGTRNGRESVASPF